MLSILRCPKCHANRFQMNVQEQVQNGISGYIVDPRNIQELSGTIIKLLEDEKLRRNLGKQGRRLVVQKFSWDKVTKNFSAAFQKVRQKDRHGIMDQKLSL